jgi:hypothetical protein
MNDSRASPRLKAILGTMMPPTPPPKWKIALAKSIAEHPESVGKFTQSMQKLQEINAPS